MTYRKLCVKSNIDQNNAKQSILRATSFFLMYTVLSKHPGNQCVLFKQTTTKHVVDYSS